MSALAWNPRGLLEGQMGRDQPMTLAEVMVQVEEEGARGDVTRFEPLPLGFQPLDDVLSGGVRPGELLVLGGSFGVGKTIFALQAARNVAQSDEANRAVYVCYEHDVAHLMSRLVCLESAEQGDQAAKLTLAKLANLALDNVNGVGLISRLRRTRRYTAVLDEIDSYADRLVLVRASGVYSTLERIRDWVEDLIGSSKNRLLLVVDYLQKVPVDGDGLQSEAETITRVAQGLKDLAVSTGIRVIAIAASDRAGLQSTRMRLAHLRGGSALQYEADIGIVLNNKQQIVSREHLAYNAAYAQTLRNWVVVTVEKNRAGINAVDMEYAMDTGHFRLVPTGGFVRERLVDGKMVMV